MAASNASDASASRRTTATLGLLAALLGVTAVAHAAPDGRREFTGGAHFYKRVLTNTNPLTTTTTVFRTVPGLTTRVPVPPNSRVLVNVGFDAESRCSGGTGQNWCELRVVIDGAEGNPRASTYGPDTFAFDSTDGGSETLGSWESHAFSRHACVVNTTSTTRLVPVRVDWRVTSFGGAPTLWLDDTSLVVELSRGCALVEQESAPARAPDLPASPTQE
ncbi:hypothetical protein [Azohydromonas aeria]|uniref:hypothetical protein n=1 Tax=Azohydromonas aeria TaxID=2590212 RepID=UPI0012FBC694|nr:hypothetical protein [Azohydromonas aeria]